MAGSYHQRLGDITDILAGTFRASGRFWGRQISDSGRSGSQARPGGQSYGYQLGATLLRFGPAGGRSEIGMYSSAFNGAVRVRGFSGGLLDQYVGRTAAKASYAGVYWTYLGGCGLYVDTVLQRSWYDGHAESAAGNRIALDGSGMLGSIESGYTISISGHLTIEPQAQLVAQSIALHRMLIPDADITQHGTPTLTGRLGARLVGTAAIGGQMAQPYIRANLWKQFGSSDRTTFSGGAGDTIFHRSASSLYGQAGAGITIPVGATIAAYG